MREDLIRGSFSLLAAAVLLGMSQEYLFHALSSKSGRLGGRAYWELGPAGILLAFSVLEAHKVWTRGERLLGLTS